MESVRQRLVTAPGETADGTMGSIVDGAVVAFHIRHQIVDEIETEHIAAEIRHGNRSGIGRLGQQFIGIAIGQHHYHLFGLPLGNQVVEDIVHAAHLIIHLFGVGGSADEIEHGILFLRVLLVAGRQADHRLIDSAQVLGIVVDVFHTAVGNGTDVVGQTALTGNLEQTVLKTFVWEILVALRIHDAHAIDNETVGIHVGGGGSESCGPQSGRRVFLHRLAASKLHIDLHILGLVVLVLEGYGAVGVANGRGLGRGTNCPGHE